MDICVKLVVSYGKRLWFYFKLNNIFVDDKENIYKISDDFNVML